MFHYPLSCSRRALGIFQPFFPSAFPLRGKAPKQSQGGSFPVGIVPRIIPRIIPGIIPSIIPGIIPRIRFFPQRLLGTAPQSSKSVWTPQGGPGWDVGVAVQDRGGTG